MATHSSSSYPSISWACWSLRPRCSPRGMRSASRAEHRVPVGVYRPGASIANVKAYEVFLGMPPGTAVSYVLDFMLDQPAWAQFEAAALQKTANSSDSS